MIKMLAIRPQSVSKVYGSWFYSDFRTVVNLLEIAGIPFSDESESFDMMDPQGLHEYLEFNLAATNVMF